MRSFRAKLIVATAGIALLAIALTTWAIAARTQDAIIDRLDERNETEGEILEQVTEIGFLVPSWTEATEFIEALADEYDARIVVTDFDGRPLADSGSGSLPETPVAIVDPFSPLDEFAFEISEDDLNLMVSSCLTSAGIEHFIDEFGVVEAPESDPLIVEECYDQAFEELAGFDFADVPEPAYLFVEYDVEPPVPWLELGLVAAVVLGAAVVAATVAGGVISGPVRRLTEATNAIRSGDLSARVDGGGEDEVGELAESFNEMAESLEQADQRRKQLTSDVAHELRSPVTNIIGHLDAVEDGVSEPTPEHLGVISAEAQRLHHLIEDLGQLAEADEGDIRLFREEQNVGAIVSRAVDARKMVAEERSVAISCDCPTAMASVDARRIEQVIGNLLDNALAAVSEGGAVHADLVVAADQIRIDVVDDGPGIPDELIDSLFDRMRRGDRARTPGTTSRGLGLAIARALVGAHGGSITAENRAEGGARFTVTLPV